MLYSVVVKVLSDTTVVGIAVVKVRISVVTVGTKEVYVVVMVVESVTVTESVRVTELVRVTEAVVVFFTVVVFSTVVVSSSVTVYP